MSSPHPVRAASHGGPPGRDGLRCDAGVGGSEFLGGIIIRCPAIQAHNREGWIKRS